MSMELKLSIITICLNEKYIEDTCRSVVEQSWKNFEWIVVDGDSTDGTLDVLNRYKERVQVFISEKDNGRYDAMNKGIAHARGEFLLFLNGGDYLAHSRVLEYIFENKPIPSCENTALNLDTDILYGEILAKETGMIPYPDYPIGPQQFSLKYFASCNSLWHQATFIRGELFERFGLYDTTYQYAADYDWFMKVLLIHKVRSTYLPMPVTVYNFEGASSIGINGEKEMVIAEIKKIYEKYELILGSPSRSYQSSRKKFYQYLPNWIKKILRPIWNILCKVFRRNNNV